MNPAILQTLCQLAIAFGLIIAALGGFGAYYYGKLNDENKIEYNKNGNVNSYNQSGGITAQTVNYIEKTTSNFENPDYLLKRIKQDHEELTNLYSQLSLIKLEQKDFLQLKEIVLKICYDFESNKSKHGVERYQNNIFLICSILVKNFPLETLSDPDLKDKFIKYDSWFIYKSTTIEKENFEKAFIKYLSDSDFKKNKNLIFSAFSLFECDRALSENYDAFITNLKSELKKDRLIEILAIPNMKKLRKFSELYEKLS